MAKKENEPGKNTLRDEPSTPKTRKKSKGDRKLSLKFLKDVRLHRAFGLLLIILAIYTFVAFFIYLFTWQGDDQFGGFSFWRILTDSDAVAGNYGGRLGAALSHLFIKQWFGIASFLFPIIFFALGVRLFINTTLFKLGAFIKHSIFLLVVISLTISFILNETSWLLFGGGAGYQLNLWLNGLMGKLGTGLLIAFSWLSWLIFTFNVSFNWLAKPGKTLAAAVGENQTEQQSVTNILTEDEEEDAEDKITEDDHPEAFEFEVSTTKEPKKSDTSGPELIIESPVMEETVDEITEEEEGTVGTETKAPEHYGLDTEYDPKLDLRDFRMPDLDLLEAHGSNMIKVNDDEVHSNKDRIINTLNNYSISIEKIRATVGPTVTLYEIVPAPGIRISKIKNLEDDIALSLSALGIRIIAPMPGKGTIGIEVPNQKPEIVSMRSILASEKFTGNKFDLPIGLGKTISNESFVYDLAKMPHLLMAGATGQGKSVGLNAIITSLLYRKHPSELKFVLVDPKKVELTLFSRIERHYLAKLPDSGEPIITDTRKVVRTLNSLCIEMDTRYDLMKDAQVRNIKEYNAKFIARLLNPNDGHRYLPYIVLVVDEFADLIMTAGKEIETPITRLAQLARAIGIHLIIATQRPSVNIITGTIKANFPARIAFRVTSKIDSRTILDTSGADQLIGRGDMLLATGSDIIRLQCAFIDTPEIEKLTEFIGSQRAYPDAWLLPEYLDEESEPSKDFDPTQKDELFDDAARVIVQHQHGSTSLLQRKLKLGYNRAGRIIDQLEAAGIVGPFEGSRAREVLIKDEMMLEHFLREKDQTKI